MDVERVVVKMVADVTQFDQVVGRAETRLANFGSIVPGLGLLTTAATIAAASVAAMTVAVGVSGIAALKMAANYEQAAIAFEVMTGSAATGKKVLDDLVQLAIQTPFRSDELIGSARQLKAYGIETNQLIPSIRMLGDVSSGTGTSLARISLAYGQVASAGRLMGTELRQFTNAGIPIIEALATVMGKPAQAIKGMITAGDVGFPEVVKAFQLMTREGGVFANMMERQSKTLAGRWNTFLETIEVGFRNLGLAAMEGLGLKELLTYLTGVLTKFGDFKDTEGFFRSIRDSVGTVWEWVRAVWESVLAVGEWVRENRELVIRIGYVLAGLTALTVATTAVIGAFTAFTTLLSVFTLPAAIAGMAVAFIEATGPVGALALALTGLSVLTGTFDNIGKDIVTMFDNIGKSSGMVVEGIRTALANGDLAGAARVGFTGIKIAWAELVFAMRAEWERFKIDAFYKNPLAKLAMGTEFIKQATGAGLRTINPFDEELFLADSETFNQELEAIAAGIRDRAQMGYEKSIANMEKRLAAVRDLKETEVRTLREQLTNQLFAGRFPDQISGLGSGFFDGLQSLAALDNAFSGPQAGVFGGGLGVAGQNVIGGALKKFFDAQAGYYDVLQRARAGTATPDEIGSLPALARTARDAWTELENLAKVTSNTAKSLLNIPLSMSAKTIEYSQKLSEEFSKGANPFDKLKNTLNMLEEGFNGPAAANIRALAAVGGASPFGIKGAAGVLSQDEYKFGLVKAYQEATKGLSKLEDRLPKAAFAGSSEAMDIINKSALGKSDIYEQMKEELTQIKVIAEETKVIEDKIAAAMEKLSREGVVIPKKGVK